MRLRTILAGLTAAFLMTTVMTMTSVVLVQTAEAAKRKAPSDAQALSKFFDSGYGWCDAKVLSQYWQIDWSAAKVSAGQKILRGNQNYLDEALGAAYGQFHCGSAFNYDDSKALAALWDGQAAA